MENVIEKAAKPAAENSPCAEAEESRDNAEACQESESREKSQISGQEERDRSRSQQQDGRSNRNDEARQGRHARGNRGSGWFTLSRANFPKISHHPTVWRAALLHLKIVNHCGINLVCCL